MGKKSKKPKTVLQQRLDGSISSGNTIIEETLETSTVITWHLSNYSKIKKGEVKKVRDSSHNSRWVLYLQKTKNKVIITFLLDAYNDNMLFGIRTSDGKIFNDISCEELNKGTFMATIVKETISNTENKLLNNDILIMQWTYTARPLECNIVLMPGCQLAYRDLMENSDTSLLCNDLRDLYMSSRFHDFLINFNGNEFKAHKFILCARSAYFKRVANTNPYYCNEDFFNDMEPDIMHQVLLYIYSGCLTDTNTYDMSEIFDIACSLEIESLIAVCKGYFLTNFSVDNIRTIAWVVEKYEDAEMAKAIKQFLDSQPKSVLQSDKWKDIAEDVTAMLTGLI